MRKKLEASKLKHLIGEFIGTFILVFLGCGSVAVCILFNALELWQVALIWGAAVSVGIFITRKFSDAHFNPAVTIAMVSSGDLPFKHSLQYLVGQIAGAFIAAAALYVIFNPALMIHETALGITRGAPESVRTAAMFGEFYPNPLASGNGSIGMFSGFMLEALGTFVLVFMIYLITLRFDISGYIAPILIGLVLAVLIYFIANFTQAGFNPARDLVPRLFAWMSGWGNAAFSSEPYGWLIVYVLGPLIGGFLAAISFITVRKSLTKTT